MIHPKIAYCCICGKLIDDRYENETGFEGEFEQYACSDHTEQESLAYVNEDVEGYDSRTGKKGGKEDGKNK